MQKARKECDENFSVVSSSKFTSWTKFSPFWLRLRDEFLLDWCDVECTVNFVGTIYPLLILTLAGGLHTDRPSNPELNL